MISWLFDRWLNHLSRWTCPIETKNQIVSWFIIIFSILPHLFIIREKSCFFIIIIITMVIVHSFFLCWPLLEHYNKHNSFLIIFFAIQFKSFLKKNKNKMCLFCGGHLLDRYSGWLHLDTQQKKQNNNSKMGKITLSFL